MKITTIFTISFSLTAGVMAGNFFKEASEFFKNRSAPNVEIRPSVKGPLHRGIRVNRVLRARLHTPAAAEKNSQAWNKMLEGVKRWEGFRPKPYYCPGGKKTIGYGHTGRWVKKGYISEADAEKLLEEQLKEAKEKVLSIVEVPLTEHQLAALTSFTFNCGCGALKKLVDQNGRLNDGNYDSVEKIMPLYRKAGGKINKGLVKRRAWELSLWNA